MNKAEPLRSPSFGLAIKQERGKVTYDALIQAGFKLLEQQDLQDISIADLAREAGYSVGAFYARFRSKDEFFDALIAKHLEIRTETQIHLFETLRLETMLEELLRNVVNYYWDHQNFWRAVLARGLRDKDFWHRICDHGVEFSARFCERMQLETGRVLNQQETGNISFAFQGMLSTINLTILSPDCPAFQDRQDFVDPLIRAFRLTADYDRLLAEARSGNLQKANPGMVLAAARRNA